MADSHIPADAAARLEEALERIAALAGRTIPCPPPEPAGGTVAGGTVVNAAAVADRLDALIATLREALARRPG